MADNVKRSASKLVYIHGVEMGDNRSAIEGPQRLERRIRSIIAAADPPDRFDYQEAMPAYENLSDGLGGTVREIFKLVLTGLGAPLAAELVDRLLDLAGDVFIYQSGKGGKAIRALVDKDVGTGNNCILAAHSLGSVVGLDLACEHMRAGEYQGKPPDQWPIRSLVTFGSPLGLKMFRQSRRLAKHGGDGVFHWYNYLDRDDPIVSGNVFGKDVKGDDPLADIYREAEDRGWHIHDRPINTGVYLLAHLAYWDSEKIARRVIDLLGRGVPQAGVPQPGGAQPGTPQPGGRQ